MVLSQEQAFLADIGANPDDDGVRLIYADWLTERDGPGDSERAEFIRVQCEWFWLDRAVQDTHLETRGTTVLFTPPVDALIERYELLVKRERLLLSWFQDRLRDEWISWVERGFIEWWEDFQVRRGFVEHITLKAAAWCRYAERLLATQPIREVTLTTRLRVRVQAGPAGDWVTFHPEHLDEPAFALRPGMSWVEQLPWVHSQADQARWLWPGIVFHGPDFPEGSV